MEILLITLIVIFSFWTWRIEKNSKDRHEGITAELSVIHNDLKEIKSGVPGSDAIGLNPNIFAVSPETAGILEKKDLKISELEKNIENLKKQLKILRTSLNT